MEPYTQEETEQLKEIYRSIRAIPLEWVELKEVRDEICDCLLAGYNQASIALTNHFFERIMKLALIYHTAGNAKFGHVDVFETTYKDAAELYDDQQLHNNIQKCRKEGLISEDTEKRLINWKNKVRNGFSHAELRKVFGDVKVPIYTASFTDPASGELSEVPAYAALLVQGIIQKNWADMVAPMFFKEVFYALLEIQKKVNFGDYRQAP